MLKSCLVQQTPVAGRALLVQACFPLPELGLPRTCQVSLVATGLTAGCAQAPGGKNSPSEFHVKESDMTNPKLAGMAKDSPSTE